jgi:nucleoside 2-deoxyribosyltransferase
VYLAGGLFNAAERLHNLYLERVLKRKGYEVVLPQREALRFFDGHAFDIPDIVRSCRESAADPDSICVASADGPDADSGTAVEYGIAITATGRAVVYRTDFRTAPDREFGVNAMMTAEGSSLVYELCYFTEFDEVNAYYEKLADSIHQAIRSLCMD